MPVLAPGATAERDLSWLDLSAAKALSADGKVLLFSEESGSVGANYAVALRGTDGSPVIRLGEGSAEDLSPDGKWALGVIPTNPQQLMLYPTGPGEARRLERGGILSYDSAHFFPDGKRVIACGHEAGKSVRCYVQAVEGGAPRPLTPEGTSHGVVSPDGLSIVTRTPEGLRVYPTAGGNPTTIPGTTRDDQIVRWHSDSRSVLAYRSSEVPAVVDRIEVSTGRREFVRKITAADPTGVLNVREVLMSEDGKAHAYTFRRMLSRLFLVQGAR